MKISVALAYYNGGTYIREQVASILSELQEEDELLISVDSCEDGSKKILKELSLEDRYGRVRVIRGPGFGVVKNFENAIRKCKGDIIFLSDQDDIWLPGKRKSVLAAFEDGKVMAVVHDAMLVDQNGEQIGKKTMFSLRHSRPGKIKNFIKNSYVGCCMAFRRELIPVIMPIPKKMYMHDFWIGMAAESIGRSVMLNNVLLLYRRHDENVTDLQHGSIRFMIRKRMRILNCMILLRFRVRQYKKSRNNKGKERVQV